MNYTKNLSAEFYIADEAAMLVFGKKLAANCQSPCIIYLTGELGAGKTTLVRGFLRGLHYSDLVKSPTYTLVEGYHLGMFTIYHFDLYRLNDPQELNYIGIAEYFSTSAICLIEWPERGQPVLPAADLICAIEILDTGRNIILSAASTKGQSILEKMQQLKSM